MGLKGSLSDPGLAFRCRLARSIIQKMSNKMMTTTTREPTVTPAIAPGPKPPESLDEEVEEAGATARDGPGSSVVVEGISVFVAPGAKSVALGEALTLSASVQDISFVRSSINIVVDRPRCAARRSKVSFV